MKTIKKSLLLVLILIMALAFTGCGGSSGSTSDDEGKENTGGNNSGDTSLDDSTVVSEFSDWSEYLNLGVYEELVLNQPDLRVTDGDIDDAINASLELTATNEQIKKGKVKDGDTVNIDYEGKKDGVAFGGGTAQGYDLTIGSKKFIDGFESGLIGVEVGKTVDLNLTFPETYDNTELAGQDVVFTVKVNYINGEKKLPKLTDEWVANNSSGGSKTVEEYRNEIKEQIEKSNQEKIESELKDQMVEALLIIGGVSSYPDDLVKKYRDQTDETTKSYAESYQMEVEDFISTYYGMTEEEYEEEADKSAKESAARKMIYETIALRENLTYTQGDLNKKELEIAQRYGYDDVSAFESAMGVSHEEVMDDVKDYILEELVLDFIKSKADINIVDPSELETDNTEE